MEAIVIIVLLVLATIVILAKTIRIVPQSEVWIIESMGKYSTTWEPGVHILWLFINRIATRISTKELSLDIPPQPVITKDNVQISVDSFAMFKVFDPYKFAYGCANITQAFSAISNSALRGIIGDLTLDECLTSRDRINARMTKELDEATDKWGIKVLRLEISNIILPNDVKEANQRQIKAEREKKERETAALAERNTKLQKAQSDKETAILRAEADKETALMSAEASKLRTIKAAEAEKEAKLLAAEAAKQTALLQAEAKAESIRLIGEAQAESIRLLNEAAPSEAILRLKACEALVETAKGNATKLIIPSDISSLVSIAASLQEGLQDHKPAIKSDAKPALK